jgi:hypothetical protein
MRGGPRTPGKVNKSRKHRAVDDQTRRAMQSRSLKDAAAYLRRVADAMTALLEAIES